MRYTLVRSGERDMKNEMIMLVVTALALPVLAQETNQISQPESVPVSGAAAADGQKRQKPTEEKRREFKKRHLKLMEKALKEIGVTEEQRQQIIVLQEAHMEKMKANWKRINKARRELSKLQESGASMEELDLAIQEISDAQTEQLQILVRNRMEMERILGKEKNDLLMKKAREFFRKHGRRPGAGMPPIPGSSQPTNTPPLPPSGSADATTPSAPPSSGSADVTAPPTPPTA